MRTKQMRLIDALSDPGVQYVVPVYQRVYSWTQPHCEALLRDSLAAALEGRPHFVGTLLYRDAGERDGLRRLTLIDGQQRLATLALLVRVLRDRLTERGQDAPAWLDNCLTVTPAVGAASKGAAASGVESAPSDSAVEPKVVLSRPDRDTFAAVMLGREQADDAHISQLVLENRDYFASELADPDFDFDLLIEGLGRLTVVVAELDGGDRPQLVFESLNAKGMPLKTSDLIRNLLLTSLERDEQVRLFKQYWEPLEDRFDAIEAAEKEERKNKIGIPPQDRRVEWEGLALDAALHAWLVETSDSIRPSTRVGLYDAFKTYVVDHPELTLEQLLTSINERCSRFADDFDTTEARAHIDWAIGKPEGFGGR